VLMPPADPASPYPSYVRIKLEYTAPRNPYAAGSASGMEGSAHPTIVPLLDARCPEMATGAPGPQLPCNNPLEPCHHESGVCSPKEKRTMVAHRDKP